ncbi:helix-turn-helix transcriptional regulator [Sphingomonas sp. Mn802worker]|uniref:helix-turn-helix transcriptional regulator n=1 Tax=Sphingomonas sp. Mn802worker TaxID=629773 RepID=UPI00036D0F25|nr:AlpA family phage regulatory protein [Sphingomonas sp. Mn802worker]
MKTAAQAKEAGCAARAGRFLRVDDVIASTGLSRATIYRLVANRTFPAQHRLTIRCIGWWESEVEAWLKSRLSGSALDA